MTEASSLSIARLSSFPAVGRDLPGRIAEGLVRHGLPWAVPLGLVSLWQIAATLGAIPANVAPAPLDVARAFGRLTASGELPANIEVSFLRAFAGLLVGGSIGFALGLANGLSKWSERLLDSTVQMIRTVPHLALIPLVILWFGIEEDARLFLVGLGVLFPIYINTFHGIRTVDAQLVEMARSYDMRGFELFRRVILPGALPSIFVGLRFAIGIAWLTLIVAETIAAPSGIGYMAMNARDFMQIDVIMVAIIVYALLGKLADSSVRILERTFLGWHAAFRGRGDPGR